MTITEDTISISTPTGAMRCLVSHPAVDGKFAGILLFSEIFQITGPIRRTAAWLAGHGYVIITPEIYHELEPAGTVLPYDQAGAEKGNADKIAKEISSYDADAGQRWTIWRRVPMPTAGWVSWASASEVIWHFALQ